MLGGQLCVPWGPGLVGVQFCLASEHQEARMWIHPESQTQAQSGVPVALGGGTGEAPAPLNVPGTSLLEQCWGLGASPAPHLQAAPGFPARRRDWQEAGYPRGDPSPRLGDPAAACFLTLQEIGAGSLLWEDSRFPWQPSAAAWLLEGRRKASRKSWEVSHGAALQASREDLRLPVHDCAAVLACPRG